MNLLDFLFPKQCVQCRRFGSYLCANCFSYLSFHVSSLCLVCDRPSLDDKTHPSCRSLYAIDGACASIAYNGIAKKLIFQFKYKPYLSHLTEVLGDLFYEGIIQKPLFDTARLNTSLLVPIPLYKTKLQKRGYNQAELLAKDFGKRVTLPVIDLLDRTKNTPTQVGLSKMERKENIKGAFAIKPKYKASIKQASILLVDDVLTTGSTMLEAANILKRAGAKRVWGITLAQGQ